MTEQVNFAATLPCVMLYQMIISELDEDNIRFQHIYFIFELNPERKIAGVLSKYFCQKLGTLGKHPI